MRPFPTDFSPADCAIRDAYLGRNCKPRKVTANSNVFDLTAEEIAEYDQAFYAEDDRKYWNTIHD